MPLALRRATRRVPKSVSSRFFLGTKAIVGVTVSALRSRACGQYTRFVYSSGRYSSAREAGSILASPAKPPRDAGEERGDDGADDGERSADQATQHRVRQIAHR